MKKVFSIVAICLALSLSVFCNVGASGKLDIYLFWGNSCPHCAKEKAYLTELLPSYSNVTVHTYEIYYSQTNASLMQKVAGELDVSTTGIPFLIIGDESFVGFSDGTSESAIKNRIDECSSSACHDSVASIIDNNDNDGEEIQYAQAAVQYTQDDNTEYENKSVTLPIVGKINLNSFSLPILTVVLGVLDGFNPCAMWVLLFLISLLIGFKDRKKMWILGSTFIIASAAVYFMFMAAWLNLILFIGIVIWIRLLIGLIALFGGVYNLIKGLKSKNGGCAVTGDERRQRIFIKLREIVKNKSLFFALVGIILLAFTVNLVELVCSAGLPAVYTQVLAMNDLSSWQYYGYILLYIFFFMLDDLVIFIIAMITLRLTGISTKYSKYSNVIGGFLMIIIGVLLIFKPEWLMFG